MYATSGQIRDARKKLGNPYAFINSEGGFSAVISQNPIQAKLELILENMRSHRNSSELEEHINALLNWAWIHRNEIWANPPKDPLELLEPRHFLEVLGYRVQYSSSLGSVIHKGTEIQVGGIFDTNQKTVLISDDPNLPIQKRKFTLAHELGHACLHGNSNMQLHRDIAIDGPALRKDHIEDQADKFAALFTMPKKLVIAEMKKRFDGAPIILDEHAEFLFGEESMQYYRKLLRHDRKQLALAKTIAKATSYGERPFISMATQFDVSIEAMAHRLIELGVV